MSNTRLSFYIEACKSCMYCVQACPQNVLGRSGAVNSKGYQCIGALMPEKCVGCGICAQICPDAVISIYKRIGE